MPEREKVVTIKNGSTQNATKTVVSGIFLFVLKSFFSYLIYSALMYILIVCFVFILVITINLSSGEMSLPSIVLLLPVIKFMGLENKNTYATEDIVALFSKGSLIFAAIGSLISLIFQKVTKNRFVMNTKNLVYIYFIAIFLLFAGSLISCFMPTAKSGAVGIVPVLILFWVTTIGAYLWYLFVKNIANKIKQPYGLTNSISLKQ